MLNIAGFAREGSGEKNIYGVKREEGEHPHHQLETSRDSDHKDVKLSREYLASRLDREVIPNQLSYGPQDVQRKGDKNTFYCEVCYVELNSLEMMKSHTQRK